MSKITALILAACVLSGISTQAKNLPTSGNKLYFIENKGQITDQYSAPRNDIQFVLPAPGLSIFFGSGQIHYQFNRITIPVSDLPGQLYKDYNTNTQTVKPGSEIAKTESYRMDVELIGANKNAVAVSSGKQVYYENLYLAGCPGGVQAHTFTKITYQEIYPDINWVIYIKDNKLEHEFIVGPNGNAANIKLKYNGQTSLDINNDGSITARTPMGTITEHAPVCFFNNGKKINSSYSLNGNILSYAVSNKSGITIDPVLEWGTYYGPDSNNTSFYAMQCDGSGHIYASGLTYSETSGNVATTGTYQSVYGGGCDAFLIKLDTAGNRLWGTYFGGSGGDWGTGVSIDPAGNVYLLGTTNSTSGISTTGCQQPTAGGNWDGFIAKFDGSGSRVWATYAGGTGIDYMYSIACDLAGHVYIAGSADSYTNIATPGSFKSAHGGGHDDFLIQYDLSGVRQWGTYLGGNGDDFGGMVCTDGVAVYVAGYTNSTTGISTPTTFQPALSGSTDAFVERFNSFGDLLWGTYYGGIDGESTGGITCTNGHLYLLGTTGSDLGIATSGSYQPARAGVEDAFLVKLDPDAGSRLWATYYGGTGNEYIDQSRIYADNFGNVYISGYSESTTGVASAGSWQTTYGGGPYDAFFAKFNAVGTLYWSTYYGGNGNDQGRACAFDGVNAYIAGQTNSTNQIATPGAFLDTGGGATFYFQGFIAKFDVYDTPLVTLNAGIEHYADASFCLYPNPNNGSFTLTGSLADDDGTAAVTVLDMAGRMVFTEEALIKDSKISKQISLGRNTPAGAYIVRVVSQNKVSMLRFVAY